MLRNMFKYVLYFMRGSCVVAGRLILLGTMQDATWHVKNSEPLRLAISYYFDIAVRYRGHDGYATSGNCKKGKGELRFAAAAEIAPVSGGGALDLPQHGDTGPACCRNPVERL